MKISSTMRRIVSSHFLRRRTRSSEGKICARKADPNVRRRYPTVFSRLLPYILQLESILDQALISGDKVKSFLFVLNESNGFRCSPPSGQSRMHHEIDHAVRRKFCSTDYSLSHRTTSTIANAVAPVLLSSDGKKR